MTITEIVEYVYNNTAIDNYIRKLEPSHLQGDLKQEMILALLEMDEDKVIKAHKDGHVVFLAIRIISNMIKSYNSRFYKMYRKFQARQIPIDYILDIHDSMSSSLFGVYSGKSHVILSQSLDSIITSLHYTSDYKATEEKDVMRKILAKRILEHISTLEWYDRELSLLYLQMGTFRSVAKETGISLKNVFTTFKRVQKSVIENCKMAA